MVKYWELGEGAELEGIGHLHQARIKAVLRLLHDTPDRSAPSAANQTDSIALARKPGLTRPRIARSHPQAGHTYPRVTRMTAHTQGHPTMLNPVPQVTNLKMRLCIDAHVAAFEEIGRLGPGLG